MSKEFLGDPTLEKRYLVAVDMYVYAENDHMARTKVHNLVELLDNDEKVYNTQILEISEQPFGSIECRTLDDISNPVENNPTELPF
jgi:hypothetical protein